ncbi:MAG: hypothetical protein IJ368_07420 [Oscillospiraceae bacterium]|nr:hypothetical protein [Oscillospiraceae bacterium]
MVKGVNKRIVEISFPDSPYFEKAVVFVRGGLPHGCGGDLEAEARTQLEAVEGCMYSIKSSERTRRRVQSAVIKMFSLAFRLSVIICAAAIMAGLVGTSGF